MVTLEYRESARAVSLLSLAALIGLGGGLLGAGFRFFTDFLRWGLIGSGATVSEAAGQLSPWLRILIPTLGGVGAALVLSRISYRRGPFGIADVMELVMTRTGMIRARDSLMQILSSALTIGSGGSIGREGANSQFAATIADMLGRGLKIHSRDRAMLLGCGIAAGMASAYKAPIAASLFTMEVILGNFAMDVLAPVVVASVMSTIVTYAFFREDPLYGIEHVPLNNDPRLVLLAIVLGVLCGFGAILFRQVLDRTRDAFARMPAPQVAKMGLGGLIVGCIGAIGFEQVWGNGQQTIWEIADPRVTPTTAMILALLFWKVVATAVTAGSGGLGGVFTPNLFVGAAFGSAFAILLQQVGFDSVTGEGSEGLRASFALVGMAGLCAASTHAPISAIVLVFELTRDYDLILPLMLCSMVASVTSRRLQRDSMYTSRLRARGHQVSEGLEELTMRTTYVRDIMRSDTASVRDTATFDEVLEVFQTENREIVYVTDSEGVLTGHVNLHDVKSFLNDASLGAVVIAADLTRPTPHVSGDESLAAIVDRLDQLGELPVCASDVDKRLVGRITRRDLVTCLSEEVLGERKLRARLRRHDPSGAGQSSYVELPPGADLRRVRAPATLAGRAFDSLDLHGEFRILPIVLIRRDLGEERRMLPHPETVIEAGDELIVIGEQEDLARFAAGNLVS